MISLVAKSAGISTEDSEEKIELVGMAFKNNDEVQDETTESSVPDKEQIKRLGIIGGIAIGALIIILAIVLIALKIIKKKRNKKNKNRNANVIMQQEPIIYNEPKSEKDNLDAVADLINIKNEKSMELKNKIREITEESPEIYAQTLKSWLRGGDKDGK